MEKLETIKDELSSDNFKNLLSSNLTNFKNNLTRVKSLKQNFTEKFSQLIGSFSEIEEKLKSLNIDNEPEESPASMVVQSLILWETGPIYSRIETGNITITTEEGYDDAFKVNIKVLKCNHQSCTIGVSNTSYKDGSNKVYLGGDLGVGNWAICPSGTFGEDGSWKYNGSKFKEGDILTIEVDSNRILTYMVNNEPNGYAYQMKITDKPVYVGFSTSSPIELELSD